MKLLQRLKNVFTDEFIDPKERTTLKATIAELIAAAEPKKEPLHAYGNPYAIDWDFMGIPFSIERQLDENGNHLMTNIGYYPLIAPTNKAREWCLPLNDDQHQELITTFNDWKLGVDVDALIERIKLREDGRE